MSDVENEVSAQHPELFHYTNLPAFENIFKTQRLWATHFEDLNDSSELRRFKLNLCEFTKPIIWDFFDRKMRLFPDFALDVDKHGGIDFVVSGETELLLDLYHSLTFRENMYEDLFVISFCAHNEQSYEATNGLLSQWRGYGSMKSCSNTSPG